MPLRVLAADDELPVRDAIVRALTGFGMVVHATSKPGRIPELIRASRPDVVVIADRYGTAGVDFRPLLTDLVIGFPDVLYVVTTRLRTTELAPTGNPMGWGASDVLWRREMFRDDALARSVAKLARSRKVR